MTQSDDERCRHNIKAVSPQGLIQCDCDEVFATKESYASHIHELNAADPGKIHRAEQAWTAANAHLDKIIAEFTSRLPLLTYIAGGNSDVSVLFDYLVQWIRHTEQDNPVAHEMTTVWCAAAITRLVRAPRTEDTDILAQLEKQLGDNNS